MKGYEKVGRKKTFYRIIVSTTLVSCGNTFAIRPFWRTFKKEEMVTGMLSNMMFILIGTKPINLVHLCIIECYVFTKI